MKGYRDGLKHQKGRHKGSLHTGCLDTQARQGPLSSIDWPAVLLNLGALHSDGNSTQFVYHDVCLIPVFCHSTQHIGQVAIRMVSGHHLGDFRQLSTVFAVESKPIIINYADQH